MRYILLAAALLVFLLLGIGWSDPRDVPEPGRKRIPDYTLSEMRAIAELSDQLDEGRIKFREFSILLGDIKSSLWAREVELFQAAEEVLEKARELSPGYIELTRCHNPNLSDREAVLMSLLRNLRRDAIDDDAPVGSAATVLEEILCELFTSGEMTPALERELAQFELTSAMR